MLKSKRYLPGNSYSYSYKYSSWNWLQRLSLCIDFTKKSRWSSYSQPSSFYWLGKWPHFFHYFIYLNLNFTVGLLPSWNRVCTLQTTHKWREKWEWLWFQLSVWSGREEVLAAYFAQSCIPTFVQLWKNWKKI